MFKLACKKRQRKYRFLRSQEERSKLKVQHKRTCILRMLTVWLTECLAGHGQQIADAGDRRFWRQVCRARPDSRKPRRADPCTLGRTAWTGSGRWRQASCGFCWFRQSFPFSSTLGWVSSTPQLIQRNLCGPNTFRLNIYYLLHPVLQQNKLHGTFSYSTLSTVAHKTSHVMVYVMSDIHNLYLGINYS